MKTLYIECNMGAAGDMLTAALLELIPDKQAFLDKMKNAGIPNVSVEAESAVKCGITGTHVKVLINGQEEISEDVHEHNHGNDHDHEHSHDHGHDYDHDHEHSHDHDHDNDHSHHHHSGMNDIAQIVEKLNVSDKIKSSIIDVYRLIAEAEGHVHGQTVEQVHFHEVGAMDAIADITGVCILLDMIGAERIVTSAINAGSGQVKCAHGILPVPAPATAYILQGVPSYSGSENGELCTPTGAALLKYFTDEFGKMPVMSIEKIGYGMGKKDFNSANCVRTMLGEDNREEEDTTIELSCNLDDMTPEAVAFAQERLLEGGALDVYTIPIGMKKSRQGIMLNCLCRPSDQEAMVRLIFKHTTTIGIRKKICMRYVLNRFQYTRETSAGKIRVKKVSGWGVEREKEEYEDLAEIARKLGISLEEARKQM